MATVTLACLSCGQGNRLPQDRLGAGAKCGTCGAPLLPGKPVEVTPDVLAKAARLDTLPLVADFWAPWCGPCRMMAPEFAKAASELRGRARLVKLNTEEHPKANTKYGIRGIPMLSLWQGGKERARKAGAMPAAGIIGWISSEAVTSP